MRRCIVLLALLVLGCAQQQNVQQPMAEEQWEAEELKWEQAAAFYREAEEARKSKAAPTAPSDIPVTSSKWPTAFKRRCYQLGITISQFRTIRHPDQKEWPNAYPIFSNEMRAQNYPFSKANVDGAWKEAGVIKGCYVYHSRHGTDHSAGVVLGNIGSVTDFYFYPEKEGEEPVLFYIESGGPSESFGYVVNLYRQAMGEPTRTRSEQVQNRLGGVFTNEISEYINDVSVARLSRFGDTLRVFKVEYILIPVMARLNRQLEPLRKEEASRL